MNICLIQLVDKQCDVGTVQGPQERRVIALCAVLCSVLYAICCWHNERCISKKVCVLGFVAV